MSELINLGNSRRTQLLYPTDLWPNGVPIPLSEFNIQTGKASFINGDIVDASGWDLVIIPLKGCHRFNWQISGRGAEYRNIYDKDMNFLASYTNFADSGSTVNNGYNSTFWKSAAYISLSVRHHISNPQNQSVTFWYYPIHGGERNVAFQQLRTEWVDNSYTQPLIPCHGYTRVRLTQGPRGAALWYGEDGNYLFGRGYGEEAGSYKIPEGAYYFRLQSYRMSSDPAATVFNWYLE